MDTQERIRTLRAKYKRDNNLIFQPAVVGDGQGNVIDTGIPGNVWVRELSSNGLSAPRSVRGPAGKLMTLKLGDNVDLEYDKQNRLRIAEPDADATLASGTNPLAVLQQDTSKKTSQTNIQTLAVFATLPASLTVNVRGWNPIVNTTLYIFPGAQVDLTSFVPSSTNMCYAVIFIKSDFATTEVKSSTPRDQSDIPLSGSDIQECLTAASAGDTPVYAIKLVGGQTAIKQNDIDVDGVPLQQVINTGFATGSAPYNSAYILETADPMLPSAFSLGTLSTGILFNTTSGSTGTPSTLPIPLAANYGGTGAASLTAHALVVGNGTSAVNALAPGTNRNVAISNGTDWTSRALVVADLPSGVVASPLTTKGDIWGWDTGNQRVGVGSDYAALVADSTQATGLNYTSATTGALLLPVGNDTTQKPANAVGLVRYNNVTGRYEFSTASTWVNHVRLSGDTMTGALTAPSVSVGLQAGTTGFLKVWNTGATKAYMLGNGSWYTTAVPYIQPSDNGGVAFDVVAKGGTGDVWLDIVSSDVVADNVNYETVKLFKGASANAYLTTTAAGTGTVRHLYIQTTGGNLVIGTANITTPVNKVYILAGSQADGVGLQPSSSVTSAAYNFRDSSGTAKAYLAYCNHAQDWDNNHNTLPGDLILRTEDATNGNIYFITQAGALTTMLISRIGVVTTQAKDSGTSAVLNALVVGHNTSAGASVAAGYGTGILVQGQDNNNANVNMFVLESSYTTATDASYATKTIFSAYDKSGGKRNTLQLTANGSRPIAYTFPGTQTTTLAALGGSIFDDFADVGNSTTTETDAYSHSITGNTFATNGDALEWDIYGTSAGSATATTQLKVYFGGTVVADTGAIAISTSDQWHIHVLVIRDSSTSVRVGVDIFFSGGVTFTASPFYATVTGLTLSSSQTFKITETRAGVGAATNDILAKLGKMAYQSAI